MISELFHNELEHAALSALSAADFQQAFLLADYRCRTPPRARGHCFVLRAEALNGLGDRAAALSDLSVAIELDPEDLAANRRMFNWAEGQQRLDAAAVLIAFDRDPKVLSSCIAALREAGQSCFASVMIFDDRVTGWASWPKEEKLDVSLSSDSGIQRVMIEPDPFHKLADHVGSAADIQIARPRSSRPQQLKLTCGDRVVYQVTAMPNTTAAPARRPVIGEQRQLAGRPRRCPVTIIVPIYADPVATEACLDSLISQLPTAAIRQVILVDDAAPNPLIKDLIANAARNPAVFVVENEENLGFVGSINRALQHVDAGDVILLNADTIVPDRFAERLTAIAYAAPDIGTVMPLSNNGEAASFPVFAQSSPMPDRDTIARLDRVAAVANRGVPIDVPNGVGFCLFVRHDCLAAIGGLAEVYHRGYYEDVDLCLLAREHGYRNVCAPSVYIGHVGSRSFGPDKRSLVKRNLTILEHRHPDYRRENAVFETADPLRAARAAIEQRIPSTARSARVIVTATGAVEAVALARAKQCSGNGESVLIARVENRGDGNEIAVFGLDGAIPQSSRFAVGDDAGLRAFANWIRLAVTQKIEWTAPGATPAAVVKALLGLRRPFDLLIADAGLVCPRGWKFRNDLTGYKRIAEADGVDVAMSDHADFWRRIAAQADSIFAPSLAAERFAQRILPKSLGPQIVRLFEPTRSTRDAVTSEGSRIGLLAVSRGANDRGLVRDLAIELSRDVESKAVVVLGTMHDEDLVQSHRILATGKFALHEVATVLDRYEIGTIVSVAATPIFGHPVEMAARAAGRRCASFDWASGAPRADDADLLLNPDDDLFTIAARLRQWWRP